MCCGGTMGGRWDWWKPSAQSATRGSDSSRRSCMLRMYRLIAQSANSASLPDRIFVSSHDHVAVVYQASNTYEIQARVGTGSWYTIGTTGGGGGVTPSAWVGEPVGLRAQSVGLAQAFPGTQWTWEVSEKAVANWYPGQHVGQIAPFDPD